MSIRLFYVSNSLAACLYMALLIFHDAFVPDCHRLEGEKEQQCTCWYKHNLL